MFATPPDTGLENYLSLLHRVDQLCGKITGDHAGEIACRAGCSACCLHLSLFPVEAASLVRAIRALPDGIRSLLAARSGCPEDGPCPLLQDGLCLVYRDRPVICRTHGLPLLLETAGEQLIDCCPENFRGTESLPGSAVIRLETLNTALATINGLFVRETAAECFRTAERFTIAHIIMIATEKEIL